MQGKDYILDHKIVGRRFLRSKEGNHLWKLSNELTRRPNRGTIILTRFRDRVRERRLIYNFDKEGKVRKEGRKELNSGFLSANKLPRGELAGFLSDWYETGYD